MPTCCPLVEGAQNELGVRHLLPNFRTAFEEYEPEFQSTHDPDWLGHNSRGTAIESEDKEAREWSTTAGASG